MTTFTLEGQMERVAAHNPFSTLEHTPLYHQLRTFEALERSHLVVNTYNTGTGKTMAALLQLFRLNGTRKNVLFIAPTNALIGQHTADIREFVAKNKLDFFVGEVNAAELRKMADDRSGETLYRLMKNPQTYYEWFGLQASDHRKRPLVMVVNPDIFYYALYFRYHRHDQRNLFSRMVTAFAYVVIDEFHYYNSKQLANFLFYFLLLQKLGRFDGMKQRVCLLSATPTEAVETYLNRVFADEWRLIAPDNEPAEANQLSTMATLTPLEVTVVADELQIWAQQASTVEQIRQALTDGAHGAIISSTLWRVNESYATLRRRLGAAQLARITGAEPEEKRQQATAQALILATPTVDIGYNFKKYNKERQNIDFLACDGRFTDEVIQRLGRAGRVLGKNMTDQLSKATLLLDSEQASTFHEHDGKTISRYEFAQWLKDHSGLQVKHDLAAYIRSHAIMECFYPLMNVQKNMSPEMREEMNTFYERICEVFAPRKSFAPGKTLGRKKLAAFFSRYRDRTEWLKENKEGKVRKNRKTAQMVADQLKWINGEEHKASDLEPYLSALVGHLRPSDELRTFVAGQIRLTESLFSFRDSFQGPTAAIYDPDHLLSSETFNEYDLLHLLSNYELKVLSAEEFARFGHDEEIKADCYVRLLAFRDPKLTIELLYEVETDEEEWKKRYCRCPIALKGFDLLARERGGDRTQLPKEIKTLISERYLVALILPPADEGVLLKQLRGTSLYSRRLEVRFQDGTSNNGYKILLGTAAWLVEAELRGHFLWKQRKECDAIIL